MQTTDLDKNYDALGRAFIEHLREFAYAHGPDFEAAQALADAAGAALSPELLGRFAETLGDFMTHGDGAEAINEPTLSKQAAIAMFELFGWVPSEPRAISTGWVAIMPTGLSGEREPVIRKGTLLGQHKISASETRVILENRGWFLGLRMSRAPNGYCSAQICAYGQDGPARAKAQAWLDAGLPMSGYRHEDFFTPEPPKAGASAPKPGLFARLAG